MRNKPFESLEEIKQFHEGEKVQCLECGDYYLSLGHHVRNKHDMTAAQYKEKWNYPPRFKLTAKSTQDKKRNVQRKLIAEGKSAIIDKNGKTKKKYTEMAQNASKNQFRHELVINDGAANLRNPHNYKIDDVKNIINAMLENDMTLKEVLQTSVTTMSKAAFRKFLLENKNLKKMYNDALENLSFAAQARMEKMGDRYKKEVTRLRDEHGYTFYQIGEMTSTTAMTAHRSYKR